MTHETGKSMLRRSSDSRFATRYMVGSAIDIGAGNDSLANYQHMFPLLKNVRSWDVDDGDAMVMAGIEDESFDLVHSSHCLEHLTDPIRALHNWLDICKVGGHLIIVVPDFAQYENGCWPSRYGEGHKWCFSVCGMPIHPKHVILTSPVMMNIIASFHVRLLKIELVERGYDPQLSWMDQSLRPMCEPAIEIVCQKVLPTALR